MNPGGSRRAGNPGWAGWVFLAWGLVCLTGCSEPTREVAPPQVALDRLDPPQAQLLEEARQKVLRDPRSGEAWGRLGQVLDAVDYDADARICYARASELEGASARWLYLLGLLEMQDEPESGLKHLGQAVALVDVEPDAPRLRLAQALVERGRWPEAETHLRRLLEVNPDHAGARLELARIQLNRLELDGAAQALQPCLTNAHTARPSMLLLSQILLRKGDAEGAGALARKVASMPRQYDWPDPYLVEVLRLRVDRHRMQDHINNLLMARRFEEAEAMFARLFQVFPDDPEGLLLLGRMRIQEQKCAEAETILLRYVTAHPQALNGYIQLGIALLCQQRWEDAAVALRRALALKPDFAQAHYNLGYALSRSGQSQAALESFNNALRCDPGDVDSHVALANELFAAGRPEEAERHLQRALELHPGHPKARRLREQHPLPP